MKTLFTGVRILDCTGAEPYAGEVLLAGNRIAEVVHSPARAARDQTTVIDGRGATLMPGLIESRGRLSIDNADDLVKIGMAPPEETMLIAARNATLYLDCGITSCISAASAKPRMDVVIRNAIQKGEIPGPRLLAASPWLTVTGGLGDMRTQHMPHITSMALILDGPEYFRRVTRELIREGVDIIKLMISGDTFPHKHGSPQSGRCKMFSRVQWTFESGFQSNPACPRPPFVQSTISYMPTSNNRFCPPLNEAISSQQCGSERGTKIPCPSDCPYSPYAIANYDQGMALTQKVVLKILDFFKSEVDRPEMARLTQLAHLNDKKAPKETEPFLHHLIHFGLAFYRNSAGDTLAKRWQQKGFIGLTNDEQVAVSAFGRSFVSVLEIQEIAPGGQMWVVDLFRPEAGRLLLIDRSMAASISRFTLLFSWFLPLPHYLRVSGVCAVEVARETLETWKADLNRSFISARLERPELTREEHLAGTFHLQIERMTEIGQEWQRSMLEKLDFCRAIARFKFSVPRSEIMGLLESKPELQRTAPEAGDGFDKPLYQFQWLRRNESKALEKEMIAAFQHDDSGDTVGGLATLRVYADRVVLEAFSRQKYAFARNLLAKWLGNRLRLEAESIEDLAKMMAEKRTSGSGEVISSSEASPSAMFASGSKTSEAKKMPKASPLPPEAARETLQAFYEAQYRKFPDEPVPMLRNATPRQASRRKALRPRLIELMKIHIHGIEQTNRKEGTHLSLDWLLEELGIPELRVRR